MDDRILVTVGTSRLSGSFRPKPATKDLGRSALQEVDDAVEFRFKPLPVAKPICSYECAEDGGQADNHVNDIVHVE